MTNTSHKDSTNSYTNTNTTSYDESDDLITPKYSFEDLPSERDRENGIDYILGSILAFLLSIIALSIQLFIALSPFILVGLGIHYLFFFNQW